MKILGLICALPVSQQTGVTTKLTLDIGTIQLFLGDASTDNGANYIALARFGKTDFRVLARQASLDLLAPELFGALLARAAGLKAPRPGLAQDPATGNWWITSLPGGTPDLSRRFNIDKVAAPARQAAFATAAAWITSRRSFPTMLAWDEWINNRDRGIQNMLIDGEDCALVDHQQAFDCHGEDYTDVNKLAQLVNATLAPAAQMQIKRNAVRATLKFSADWPRLAQEAMADLPFKAGKLAGLRHWTQTRHPEVAQRIERRIAGGQTNLAL